MVLITRFEERDRLGGGGGGGGGVKNFCGAGIFYIVCTNIFKVPPRLHEFLFRHNSLAGIFFRSSRQIKRSPTTLAGKTSCHFSRKRTQLRMSRIFVAKSLSDANTHEQIIICRPLFADHLLRS